MFFVSHYLQYFIGIPLESPSSSQLVQDFATIHRCLTCQWWSQQWEVCGSVWRRLIVPVGSTCFPTFTYTFTTFKPTVERIDERIDRRPSCILVELWWPRCAEPPCDVDHRFIPWIPSSQRLQIQPLFTTPWRIHGAAIYGDMEVTWISIYPSHVSIFLPAPWIRGW